MPFLSADQENFVASSAEFTGPAWKGEINMSDTGMRKKLPVGVDNFEKLRSENFYYVDKTALIRDLLNNWGEVNLFTRPRRFGKTLNMSMLKAFFEIGGDKTLFDGLEISQEALLCEKYMGKFPVVSVTLKGIEGRNYTAARQMAVDAINEEARRLGFLAESEKLTENEKKVFSRLLEREMEDDVINSSLKNLTELLEKHYGKKVILLIDEYDVPLAKANEYGYYDDMVSLIRGMFNQSLKTNRSLYFAVLTGCLRVAKESIFTGLNNPNVLSITSVRFDEYFGFSDREVREMLDYYGFTDRYDTVKEWYDGYRFGSVGVYCPWDVISYCYELTAKPSAQPRDYWSNTSGNDVVRHFIEKADSGRTRSEIEELIAGEIITKEIHEELTYNRLYDSMDHIWSVLLTTGYLTQNGEPDGKKYQLKIPNREIRNIFTEQIVASFQEAVEKDGGALRDFCDALKTGNAKKAEKLFTAYLSRTISIRDTFVRKEKKGNFYHGIILSILGFKSDWTVSSNSETGDGYSDILAEVESEDIGIVIELKYAENARYAAALKEALAQIEERNYMEKLREDGCHTVYKYGIACFKKKCRVACEKEEFEED